MKFIGSIKEVNGSYYGHCKGYMVKVTSIDKVHYNESGKVYEGFYSGIYIEDVATNLYDIYFLEESFVQVKVIETDDGLRIVYDE